MLGDDATRSEPAAVLETSRLALRSEAPLVVLVRAYGVF
ncbi:MAG: hypothetical protein QOG42_1713 [Solirubrobacteraceae bacterium]|jgi:hypothetical protein|nr:hypothetical protein [Solirubrobacteraceae bacterium]